ncbi:MAG: hypothetical protein JXB18_11585 [Sedimentisphaerales bacterium]|nr:hypothetical protein [Sedimentisphaerales bacterium]
MNKKSQVTPNKEVTRSPKSATVHNPVHGVYFSPELQQIIDHWDGLPEHIKQTIISIIQMV